MFASHRPPKDDTVLSTARLFHAAAHPRADAEPPEAIGDLRVKVDGSEAEVLFTAPHDRGGTVHRYQIKCADRPIVPYEAFDYAADGGRTCPWWRAVNLDGEPDPASPGRRESFRVRGVPASGRFFAVRSFDGAGNRSGMSNVCEIVP